MLHIMTIALAAAQPGTGVVAAAPATIKGDPRTFDLAGLRLGMTEAEVLSVAKSRSMTVRHATRVQDFKSQVRALILTRGGRAAPGRGNVLGEAEFDDGKGGRVVVRMTAWPDSARVASIAYIAPRGTDGATWRALLTGKYGPAADGGGTIGIDGLQASWCGRSSCYGAFGTFKLSVGVGGNGGTITLNQPDGTGRQQSALVEAEAAKQSRPGAPAL